MWGSVDPSGGGPTGREVFSLAVIVIIGALVLAGLLSLNVCLLGCPLAPPPLRH